ncbi:MAG: hypothetical protein K6U74_08715 [Firmicutes bacterium]|nr:hypothetical protein [Bacillota bacterium]
MSDCDIVRVKSVSENVSMKEMVTLSQTELKRMLVLQRVLEGQAGALPLKTPARTAIQSAIPLAAFDLSPGL